MRIFRGLLSAVLVATCSISAFAQGTIIFNNGLNSLVRQWASPTDSMTIVAPIGCVQLFWAPTGTPYTPWYPSLTPAAWYAANPGWSLEPVLNFSTPVAGKFNGGTMTLSPLAPGGTIDYVVTGWTPILPSMDAAFLSPGGLVGVSTKYTTVTGDPTTSPVGSPVPLADTFGGLTLIPEPSVLALASLGVTTLLAFRRRK